MRLSLIKYSANFFKFKFSFLSNNIHSGNCISSSNFAYKMDPYELAKKVAACKAIDDHITGDCTIGIGSGSTIVYAVQELEKLIKDKNWKVSCVPTSFQAKQLIRLHGLELSDLEENVELDFVFDGADEVDCNLTLIKGGGGCLTQEKIVASCTKNLVIIADNRKDSKVLGTSWTKGIPVEVIPMAYMPVKKRLEALGGPAELRMAKAKAGPVITDNGNFILDWKFSNKDINWKKLNPEIVCIPGVVETGIFVGMATKAYFGQSDGRVTVRI